MDSETEKKNYKQGLGSEVVHTYIPKGLSTVEDKKHRGGC